jgi:KDO2-lipid IV(A) lauroyltransferase
MSETSSTPQASRRLPFARKLRYLVEAAGFFLAIGFFRLFPIDMASAIGGWIGRYLAVPTGASKLARENLAIAFPEKSDAEREHILRGMWENLGRVLAEYAHLDEIHVGRAGNRIDLVDAGRIDAVTKSGKGLMLISGHFANWEIMPTGGRDHGVMGATVVRPANNPYVNAWLERVRTRNGMPELIAKGAHGTRRIFTILRKGEGICMLVDQRASEGIPAPFFGRDALTTAAPAALALKLKAVILPVSNERVTGARYRMRVYPAIEPPDTGDADADLVTFTTAINAFIEARVRERPEEWLWIHRRWTDPDAPLRKRAQALSLGRNGATSATSSRV